MNQSKLRERREKQLNMSLTSAEYEEIQRRAEAVGMRLVDFGRAAMLANPAALKAPLASPVSKGERLYFVQLSRLGNLLNQAMRHCHRTGDPLPPDLEPLLRDIRSILSGRQSRGT